RSRETRDRAVHHLPRREELASRRRHRHAGDRALPRVPWRRRRDAAQGRLRLRELPPLPWRPRSLARACAPARMRHGALSRYGICLVLVACGGGGGGDDGGCSGSCGIAAPSALSALEVQTIVRQAVNEAQARNAPASVAVVDRVGNVLAVFRMTGA